MAEQLDNPIDGRGAAASEAQAVQPMDADRLTLCPVERTEPLHIARARRRIGNEGYDHPDRARMERACTEIAEFIDRLWQLAGSVEDAEVREELLGECGAVGALADVARALGSIAERWHDERADREARDRWGNYCDFRRGLAEA